MLDQGRSIRRNLTPAVSRESLIFFGERRDLPVDSRSLRPDELWHS